MLFLTPFLLSFGLVLAQPPLPPAQQSVSIRSQEPVKKEAEATADTSFEKLLAEADAAYASWSAEMKAAMDADTMPPFDQNPTPRFFSRFRAMAKSEDVPADDSGQATLWCLNSLTRAGVRWKDPLAVAEKMALGLLAKHEGKDWLTPLPQSFGDFAWQQPDKVADLLGRLVKTAKTDEMKASCLLQQARTLAEAEQNDDALSILEQIQKNYQGMEAVASATKLAYRIKNLRVGGVAPDFEGKDVDGNTLRLSDYRGQVVYLDFWGFW